MSEKTYWQNTASCLSTDSCSRPLRARVVIWRKKSKQPENQIDLRSHWKQKKLTRKKPEWKKNMQKTNSTHARKNEHLWKKNEIWSMRSTRLRFLETTSLQCTYRTKLLALRLSVLNMSEHVWKWQYRKSSLLSHPGLTRHTQHLCSATITLLISTLSYTTLL
jgi:hypothetical protein